MTKIAFGRIVGGSTGIPVSDYLDYENLYNKPSIEGETVVGDKSYAELNLTNITNAELDTICV